MIIELENIFKSYRNSPDLPQRAVIEELSFKISDNESIAIVGPSGSGKSTLLNLIGTLDKPTSGIIRIDNENISMMKDSKLAEIRNQRIGFVFQLHHLLPQLNLLENVLLPTLVIKDAKIKKSALSRAMDLLKSVGLDDKARQFPGQLSGGECQRTAVVRALINEPDIILADEPTGSLDQDSAEQIGSLLSKINKEQNVGLVVVTHSMELACNMQIKYALNHCKLKLIND